MIMVFRIIEEKKEKKTYGVLPFDNSK